MKEVSSFSLGVVACLSFLVMAVSFLVPCLPVVIVSGAVFFISCLVTGLRLLGKLDGARSLFFDDYGYL